MRNLLLPIFVLTVLASVPSHALFEVRVSGSYNIVNPEALNGFISEDLSDIDGVEEVDAIVTVGGDGILYLPMVPVGLGLRYQWIGIPQQKDDDTGTTFDFSFSRGALLVNYRIIDTFAWVGPIATIGLLHTLDFSFESDVVPDYTVGDFDASSFSLGAEAGVTLGLFAIGGEVGYMYWNYTNLKSNSGGDAPFSALNLSGPYAMIHVGLDF